MVKEGHDSTERPKLKTWEFDEGRRYLDEWKDQGKPALSKTVHRRIRVAKVLTLLSVFPAIAFVDFGPEETVVSPLQQRMQAWWGKFIALDISDVAKARTVRAARRRAE